MATRTVTAGQSLITAAANAQPGDVINVEAGATFPGPVVLRDHGGSTPITIQSSRITELPPDKRVSPADAGKMPRIVTPTISASHADRAFKTTPQSHHVKLIGLEFAQEPTRDAWSIVDFGDSGQTSLDAIPHSITLDRCYIHGAPERSVQRGLSLNAKLVNVLNCYISEIHAAGFDSQAIGGWNGVGQYRIINNWLEAAGENLMFGGSDPAIKNLVPENIEIRRNTFFKPMTWKIGHPSYAGKEWTVKNLLELKAAKKVIIDGNIFDGCWVHAQTGWAILFKVQNQDGGCPLCVTEDIEFTNNIIRNSTNGLNVLAYDPYKGSLQLKNVRVANNLWLVDGAWYQGTGSGKLPDGSPATNGADGLILEHNTHLQKTGNTMTLYGGPTARFVYRNNLGARTGFGIKGDATGEGKIAFDHFCPSGIVEGNVLVGADANIYLAHNFYPKTWDEVKLGADNRLLSTSPFKGKGTDGKDPGADISAIEAAMKATGTVPAPAPPPSPVPSLPVPLYKQGNAVTLRINGVIVRSGGAKSHPSLGTQNTGIRATIVAPPSWDAINLKYFYNLDFVSGIDGWVPEEHIVLVEAAPVPAPAPTPVPEPPKPEPIPPAVVYPRQETQDWPLPPTLSEQQAFRAVKADEGWEGLIPSSGRLWGWRKKIVDSTEP